MNALFTKTRAWLREPRKGDIPQDGHQQEAVPPPGLMVKGKEWCLKPSRTEARGPLSPLPRPRQCRLLAAANSDAKGKRAQITIHLPALRLRLPSVCVMCAAGAGRRWTWGQVERSP